MISYKEFREVYNKLPKERIFQKETWETVSKTIKGEEQSNTLVLVVRSANQSTLKTVWFTTDGTWVYSFNLNEEEEYNKGSILSDFEQLNLGVSYQYSLSHIKTLQMLSSRDVETLFEFHRQGKLPEKTTQEDIQELLFGKTKEKPAVSFKIRLIELFSAKLMEQIPYEQDMLTLFQRARENMTVQIGNEEHQRLFITIAPLWKNLFTAFSVPSSLKLHVQFYIMHILPTFSDVEWPGERG